MNPPEDKKNCPEQSRRVIPKLRFPEFKDSGEWEEKTLGEVLIKNSIKNKDLNIP